MKKLGTIAIYFLLVIVISSCDTTKELLPGFQLYQAPNGVDRPGRVYRLDNDKKTDFLVEYVDIKPTPYTILISEQEGSKSMNVGALISFIAPSGSDVEVGLGANLNHTATFNFKLGNAQILKISDQDLLPYYPDLVKRLKENMEVFGIKKPRFFIVREAVTAKEIYIQMDKKWSNDDSLQVKINEMININADVSWTNSKKNEIKVSLSEGLFVFYKADEIHLAKSITGDAGLYFTPANKNDIEALQIGIDK